MKLFRCAECAAAVFSFSIAGAAAGQTAAFDAASVRIFDPSGGAFYGAAGGPGTKDPGRVRYGHVPMVQLLEEAWGVEADRIEAPEWARDPAGPTFYTITATMPAETTKQQFQAMLRSLLAERFHMAAHHETRNFPGYDLVVAKGGPKLKQSLQSTPGTQNEDVPKGPRTFGEHRLLNLPPGPGKTGTSGKGFQWEKYQEQTMEQLASDLPNMIRRARGDEYGAVTPRVRDGTGLTGRYDFTFGFACHGCLGAAAMMAGSVFAANAAEQAVAADPDSGPPDLFSALEKQLGLRLVKGKELPLDVIVIDRIEKIPTDN